MKRIYFDNAASTPIPKRVLKAIKPYLTKFYGNPSSLHKEGRLVNLGIAKAREQVANALHCKTNEIFFTSGASESNSWIAYSIPILLTDGSNHDSLELATENYKGKKNKISGIAISAINSETGLSNMNKSYNDNQWVHVDLTQAIGKQNIDLEEMQWIDSASFSGHKFGALKGVGVLFVRESKQEVLKPLIYGHQENELRGGTENVVGIISLGEAIELATINMQKNVNKVSNICNFIVNNLSKNNVNVKSNNGIINITFNDLLGNTAANILDLQGIAVSVGSACNSGSDKPSKVLLLNGYTEEEALRTIRVSIGFQNTKKEARRFCRVIRKIIDKYD